MNIALCLTPKCNVTFLYSDADLLRGMRRLRGSGFSSVPVISKEGLYAGSFSEGDLLWHLIDDQETENLTVDLSGKTVSDVLNSDRNPPVPITAGMDDVLERSLSQNFIPVVDDRGVFIGIVTRRNIIGRYFMKTHEKSPGIALKNLG